MPENNLAIPDVQAAISAGAAIAEPRTIESKGMYAVVPEGWNLESLEEFQDTPARVREKLQVHDAQSFIDYINAFDVGATTVVFFDQEKERFAAVLDYHKPSNDPVAPPAPAWCDHVVSFTCRRTVEFQTWMSANRKQMSQVEFARFLEENLPDVVEPEGARLLEIALTLEAKQDASYSSGVRLQSGAIQFTYDEEVRATSQKGSVEIPEQFVLGIAIHENGPAYRIPVRLRYRLHDGKLVLWYEIVRPHRFLRDALNAIRDEITAKTPAQVYAGIHQA